MKVLFAAEEHAWGGILNKFRQALPDVAFVAAGGYGTQSLQGFDVLIPTMTKIDARLLATADQLKLIQQIGAGLEGVDLEAAKQHQIAVANVPTDISGNADSVAELGIYMMLALARNAHEIPHHFRQRESGRPMGLGLKGKTVGLIGLGGIGKVLAKRLTAFDMRLIGIKQHVDPDFAKTHHLDWLGTLHELPTLLQQADFVVLSLPDSPDTHHILNQQTFRQMKAGSFLINLGRGGLIDKDALETALKSGHLAGAGLDVFWQEPPDPTDPIFQQNIIATPHIGGVTDISVQGIFEAACDNIRRLQTGEPILHRHA
ncbi:D-isomer specific 2-hydroxyacid dehydrogenase NAD-binding [Tolumonas auensis DSM 9187]|uniref:D-isomer specific 2-hydroxyacid dehydrogenase NAD-binding n=1 Tax=Tolumonas auensis (strain DSM 9187 / NBRC 110442 / TA 4) TaxID=595494 RepID=C4LFM2_TOLAT|nr:2-hydroxyacid dehydrogenase [Tolumonas auensis]ACQ93389.1 D-isomer specific 2-hydroxyacid dehydrogenase NAD-binding [Tolumonas auensis DSM 9187]